MTAPAVARLWGCGDLDALFHGSDRVMLPWPRAPRTRGGAAPPVHPDVPPRLEQVDPRPLRASQPWVVRHHASFYLTGVWEHTGQTSADMASAANRYPIITIAANGDHTIRTGHHRSLAALIEGRPVSARVVRPEPSTVKSDRAAGCYVVTPLIRVESCGPHLSLPFLDSATLAAQIASGVVVTVGSLESAAAVLAELGLDVDQVSDRIAMATRGRTLTSR